MNQKSFIILLLICGLLLSQTQFSFAQFNCNYGLKSFTPESWATKCVAGNSVGPNLSTNPGLDTAGNSGIQHNPNLGNGQSSTNIGCYLNQNFNSVFPNGITIGCASGFELNLSTEKNVMNFLPAVGIPGALSKNYTNPNTSSAGELAGQLVALTLNVGFDNFDNNFAPSTIKLKDKVIISSVFPRMTVTQFLMVANQVVGGCRSDFSFSAVNEMAKKINGLTPDPELLDLVCIDVEEIEFVVEDIERARLGINNNAIISSTSLTNFPNPFNNNTNIEVSLNYDSPITMEIYNFSGELISTVFTGNVKANEKNSINFDGSNLTEGAYYCKLTTAQGNLISKMILIK
jgi:hypothetical protein